MLGPGAALGKPKGTPASYLPLSGARVGSSNDGKLAIALILYDNLLKGKLISADHMEPASFVNVIKVFAVPLPSEDEEVKIHVPHCTGISTVCSLPSVMV